MRINYIELLGEKYPMVFSSKAGEMLVEEFGSLDNLKDIMTSDNPFKAANTILKILTECGRKYCEVMKIDCPPPLPCEPADIIDMSDPNALTTIFKTIAIGNEREVEVVEKNGVTTPSK